MTSAVTPPAADETLLSVRGLSIHFPVRGGGVGAKHHVIHAVDDVSLDVRSGETVGVVGESGSGKTTLAYGVLGYYKATAGHVLFRGVDVTGWSGERLRQLRQHMQMVFQDPYSSLNPRMRIEEVVGEPLIVHRRVSSRNELRRRVAELLQLTGMSPEVIDRYPHAFSGGQRQRIGIARALALEPSLVVADEPTSALDVSVQAQVINLLRELQDRLGLTYLFISHNLAVVRHISHRIAIMYCGKLVEVAPTDEIFERAQHPYTRALLSAIPIPDPASNWHRKRTALRGEVPSPINPPRGCRFSTRCPSAFERCHVESPPLVETSADHWTACWLVSSDAFGGAHPVGEPARRAGSSPATGLFSRRSDDRPTHRQEIPR